jgi:hypothetical protein
LRLSEEVRGEYSTKELSRNTWPDLVRLFRKQGLVG